MNKKFLLLSSLVVLVLLVAVVSAWPDGKLHISACDVGQGDASYLRMPNGADVLIDGGPDAKILNCLGEKMPFYDRSIDLVVLTHPHKDHFFGLIDVLRRYRVKKVVIEDVGNAALEYMQFIALLREREVTVEFLAAPANIALGEVNIEILWPRGDWLSSQCVDCNTIEVQSHVIRLAKSDLDLNMVSYVMLLQYKNFDALLTGDADILVEDLYRSHVRGEIEYLKIPHHGSKAALSVDFMQTLKPQLSIVSVGRNSYGHPDLGLIQSLERYGDVFRTDKSGTITFATDGYSVWSK